MKSRFSRLVIVCCWCFIVASSQGNAFRAFPTEIEVSANLHRDMTVNEVLALFGEPFNGRPERCINCSFRYLAPTGMLTDQREGYQGFEVQFDGGRVRDWRVFRGLPSYNPNVSMPSIFKWEFKIFGILIILGMTSALLLRVVPIGVQKSSDVLRAFATREIPTKELPSDFQFITHETTLQEVITRLGRCSRKAWLPVDAQARLGSGFAMTKSGKAAILSLEYHLPYHAAVVIMPEYPFEPENRIRAVFYRPVQRELAESRFSER